MTTSSKQDFLSIAAAGSALAPIKFGLGGVPFGNEFEVVSDEDAYKTLEAAWNAGVRYYDVAPWYGLGLGERRYGNFLHNKNRDGYVLSSKVGKLLKASPHNNAKSNFLFSPSPNNVVFDQLGMHREPQRRREPDDLPAPRPRDEMNRKTVPGRD
jgi:D-threo-aldose 1-dehydrogenase